MLTLKSTVVFQNGKTDVQFINNVPEGEADKIHHVHQRAMGKYWHPIRFVVGGHYQVFNNFIAALIKEGDE